MKDNLNYRKEKNRIYLDNAATTIRKPKEVVDAVVRAMQTVGNPGRGSYESSLAASRIVYEARETLAELFNAEEPARIAFTSNATVSLNVAIKGILQKGDHVITTAMEHNSVLRPLYEMEKCGVEVTIIDANMQGRVDVSDFNKYIKENTKAIICTHASNVTGNVNDIEKIGQIAKENSLLFVVDASQTAGILNIDVKKMNIDVLCFTGHKCLCGPQGTGGIYVKKGVDVKPLITGGSGIQSFRKEHPKDMPTAIEAGTINVHGIAGLLAGVKYIKEHEIDKIRSVELGLMKYFYENIKLIPDVKIYGDFETKNRAPIVAINIENYNSTEVSDELFFEYGIETRAGFHCAPLMHKALGTENQGVVRFSFSHYNTKNEVDSVLEAIKEIIEN